jgi:TM2 domain-containing membrane protein YozV
VEKEKSDSKHKFCSKCGKKILQEAEMCPHCGVRQPNMHKGGEKNKLVAALLAIFLGTLGLHKFYLGKIGWGITYLLLSFILGITVIVPLIIALISFIEGISYLAMSDESFTEKYG